MQFSDQDYRNIIDAGITEQDITFFYRNARLSHHIYMMDDNEVIEMAKESFTGRAIFAEMPQKLLNTKMGRDWASKYNEIVKIILLHEIREDINISNPNHKFRALLYLKAKKLDISELMKFARDKNYSRITYSNEPQYPDLDAS